MEADQDHLEFVTLVAGGQSFCIEIEQVREIRRWSPVTSLPHAQCHVLGVMNLRGAVIPVLDLAAKLGFPTTHSTPRHVVIIVSLHDRIVGLLVDSVSEIRDVPLADMRETPCLPEDDTIRCVSGLITIEGEMTRVIDLAKILPAPAAQAAH